MPGYNMWTPRTNAFVGNQLQHMQHGAKHYAQHKTREFAGEIGSAAGSAIGFAAAGARRFGQWYYPSETIRVRGRRAYMPKSYTRTVTKRKKTKKKKVCCRYYRGKKYCSPEFCEKRRKIKYW